MPPEQTPQVFLTPRELVKRWRGRIRERTLQNWRSQKRGPQWIRVHKTVLYPLDLLQVWEKERLGHGYGASPGPMRPNLKPLDRTPSQAS